MGGEVYIYFRTPSRAVLWVRKYIVPDSPVGELCGSYNKLHFGTYVLSELRMVDVSEKSFIVKMTFQEPGS